MACKRLTEAEPALFDARRGTAARHHRALFLPRVLDSESRAKRLESPDRDHARTVLHHWAELATKGYLGEHKEQSLDAEFLIGIFGEALGYATKDSSPSRYNLDREYPVPGVGHVDGALGSFPGKASPLAVIEVKGAGTDLDHDRSRGRTPVQQLWDYLAALPDCPWGILSDFVTIRLYHRDRTPSAFVEFRVADLADESRFAEFYCIFGHGGILPLIPGHDSRAIRLLRLTEDRQRSVGDKLYESYSRWRLELIRHLHREHDLSLDRAIRGAQTMLDRIIFIAFCEDRGLLPDKTIERTYTSVPPFAGSSNPRFRNFLDLFRAMDEGHPRLSLPTGYNGGLFRYDEDVDGLDLPDIPWAVFFQEIGLYDFRDEINVDVLGHLFEKSITELERLRVGGLFSSNGDASGEVVESPMPKSAQRKWFGIYYTPPEFTGLIVAETVDHVVRERFDALAEQQGINPNDEPSAEPDQLAAYWRSALDSVKNVRIVDPACGSGAFLIRAYDAMEEHYRVIADGLHAAGCADEAAELEHETPDLILTHNLFGVDLSPQAVEITQLALWLRSAIPGRMLADLSRNIVCGNSLVDDPAVHERAMDWRETFPEVFGAGGFNCVIGNPPWERVKLQEREFFAMYDPQTAQAVSAADRRRRIAEMSDRNPKLYEAYQRAQAVAAGMLDYARHSGRYPLTGRGDINTYVLFAELARQIVAPDGMVGLLVPSGIATDKTIRAYFDALVRGKSLALFYDFENRRKVFPDVDGRFKFSVLVFGGSKRRFAKADFVFFAHSMDDLRDTHRHIRLSAKDLTLLNPNTRTCPIFRSRRDADLTRAVYRRVPVLIDRSRTSGGNPWGIRFVRMFDQTNDAELFTDPKTLRTRKFRLEGSRFVKGKRVFLPLYEAKMVQAFDHRAASVVVEKGNWVRQGQKDETSESEHSNPEHLVLPRYWVDEAIVSDAMGDGEAPPAFLCFKDVTSPTNERTMIASFLPLVGAVNSAPIVVMDPTISLVRTCCLLANLNAIVLDYIARQKVGGVHLNFFIVEQLPVLDPGAYADRCPWDRRTRLESWVSQRVLKLSCTAQDMRPLAEACGFRGSEGNGVHKWRAAEREELRAELDAAYFHLYGLKRRDVEYVLSTFTTTRTEAEGGLAAAQDRRSVILEHYDRLAERE